MITEPEKTNNLVVEADIWRGSLAHTAAAQLLSTVLVINIEQLQHANKAHQNTLKQSFLLRTSQNLVYQLHPDDALQALQQLTEPDKKATYNFFLRARRNTQSPWKWHLVIGKQPKQPDKVGKELILIANPMQNLGIAEHKIDRMLEATTYVQREYHRFATLSKREKEIIVKLCEGKTNQAIAQELQLSKHTIDTHRKKINKKIGSESFAQLVKFAIAFDLI